MIGRPAGSAAWAFEAGPLKVVAPGDDVRPGHRAEFLRPIDPGEAHSMHAAYRRYGAPWPTTLCAKRSRATAAYVAVVLAGGSNDPPPQSRPREVIAPSVEIEEAGIAILAQALLVIPSRV